MQEYMACMQNHKHEHQLCRELSRAYLQCRMDNSLMDEDDLDEFGFSKEQQIIKSEKPPEPGMQYAVCSCM